MIVLGVVGENSGGKETFAKLLSEIAINKKVIIVKFSDVIRDTLKIWDIIPTRDNFTNLSLAMNKAFGDGTLPHAIYSKVMNTTADIVILDGPRGLDDEELVRKFPKNFMVYVTASVELRYERSKKRNEKAGEDSKTFEKFLSEEKGDREIYIPEISKRSNYKIENNGTVEDYKEKIKKFYEEFIIPQFD